MKAIRVHEPGGPEVLRYEDVPEPTPNQGELLVQVEAAGLNFIDVYFRKGQYKGELPLILGQEGAGKVTALGPGTSGQIQVGDRVAWTNVLGSYAQQLAVPESQAVKLDRDVTRIQAAAVMLQGLTAHYLSTSTFELKPGHTCLIHAAAGGVG